MPWDAALQQHERWLRTVVYSRVGEAQAVDDVMQEVALAVGLFLALSLNVARWPGELVDPSPSAERAVVIPSQDPPQPAERPETGYRSGDGPRAAELSGDQSEARPGGSATDEAPPADGGDGYLAYHTRWLDYAASAFPPELAQMLESTGNRLRSQRALLPLETPEGQMVLVPVEHVEIIPAQLSQYR